MLAVLAASGGGGARLATMSTLDHLLRVLRLALGRVRNALEHQSNRLVKQLLSLARIASLLSCAHRSAWTLARVVPGLSCDTFAQELWAPSLMVLGTARVLNASG